MEEVVKHLVQHALGGQEWAVRRIEQGWSDTSYVALQGGRRVFVKFGTPADLLRRVAELGVAPAVLAAGEYQGTSYVIQEFIEGKYPDHRWVHDHTDDVAGLLRTLHRDAPLRTLLNEANRPVRQLRDIEISRQWAATAFADRQDFRDACAWLITHRPVLREDDLVPTHGDVSPKNFLIAPRRLVMIDWDDLALADPMRDIGPLAWWYFPPSRWPGVLKLYGLALIAELASRIYWWTACISLDVTAGLLERGYRDEARGFLDDFLAAASSQPNPRPQNRGLSR